MPNIGAINVQIRADISQIQANLRALQQQMTNTSNHIQQQNQSIQNSFSSMARGISTAIKGYLIYEGFNLLTGGIKDAINEFNKFESANLGLKSILEAQGKSFGDANEFIQGYVADGLVPLTDAVTAFKSLSARGYGIDQIKMVMNRLKDASAFGRQSALTMGQAVAGAAEGLKNENSMLVDNAGITKNVAKMWEEYAKSIGTTANNLTMQQKIQAEVNGIMQESQFQVGNATLYSQTLSGQLARLSAIFTSFKVSVGEVFAPILQAVLPIIMNFTLGLTKLMKVLSSWTNAIFGNSKAQQENIKSTINIGKTAGIAGIGQDKLTKSAKKSKKAIQDNIQSFDELHQLQKDMSNSAEDAGAGAGAGIGDIGGIGDTNGLQLPEEYTWFDYFKGLGENLYDWWTEVWNPAWEKIGADVYDFVMKDIPKWINEADNFFQGLGADLYDWWTEEVSPAWGKIGTWMGEKYDKAKDIIIKADNYFQGLGARLYDWWTTDVTTTWNNIGTWMGNKYDDAKKAVVETDNFFQGLGARLYDWWIAESSVTWDDVYNYMSESYDNTKEAVIKVDNYFQDLGARLYDWWVNEVEPTWDNLSTWMGEQYDDTKKTVIKVDNYFQGLGARLYDWWVENVSPAWGNLGTWMGQQYDKTKASVVKVDNYFQGLGARLYDWWTSESSVTWSNISTWMSEKYDVTKKAVIKIDNYFKGLGARLYDWWVTEVNPTWDNLSTWMGEQYDKLKEAVVETDNFFQGLGVRLYDWWTASVSPTWTSMKDDIKKVFSDIGDWINKWIDKFNKLTISVPSFNIPLIGEVGGYTIGMPKIPALATGGIVTSPTMAMIGEGKYNEAVIPLGGPMLDSLTEGIANAVVGAMSILSSGSKKTGDVVLNIDGKQIARVLNPYMETESKRSSTKIIMSS